MHLSQGNSLLKRQMLDLSLHIGFLIADQHKQQNICLKGALEYDSRTCFSYLNLVGFIAPKHCSPSEDLLVFSLKLIFIRFPVEV